MKLCDGANRVAGYESQLRTGSDEKIPDEYRDDERGLSLDSALQ